MLLSVVGVLMIVVGVVLLLRAANEVRGDLVAKLLGAVAGGGARPATASSRPAISPTGAVPDAYRVKTFEEEVASLNDDLGRGSLND